MDIMKILGNIWLYLYPILIVSTLLVLLLNIIGYRPRNLYQYGIFSKFFIALILASFLYYLYDTLSRVSRSFTELISGFYEWAIYLAFYFLIISLIGSVIFISFRKSKAE